MRIFYKVQIILLSIVCSLMVLGPGLCGEIEARLKGKTKIFYQIYFNGMSSGTITWSYGGKREVNQREVAVLTIQSDTRILKLLDLESEEEIFLDAGLRPLQVNRKVRFFGDNQTIVELYDQSAGTVTITKESAPLRKRVLRRPPPIHNIHSLLYFFPDDAVLVPGRSFKFSLPTQTLKVRVDKKRTIKLRNGLTKEAYTLLGSGARSFKLFLDTTDMLPLRIDFFVPLGVLSIERRE